MPRNAWGSAKNIRVSIELAETEDPEIVQIINGTADFGSDLSSYAKATSANALRIKINDNCADGRHICLVLKATCDNITEEVKQDVVLKAENGVEIGGIIADDMTLHEGVHYIVTQTIAVPQGVTLTIEPGAVPGVGAQQSALVTLSGSGLHDQLRVVDGDGSEDNAGIGSLGVVDVGDEVGAALGEVLGDHGAAQALKSLGEVVDQALVIVAAQHTQHVSGGQAAPRCTRRAAGMYYKQGLSEVQEY